MSSVTIEIDEETERLLRDVAEIERRTAQEVCVEALNQFLQSRGGRDPDRYSAFREMIGLVKDGPTDSSVVHDIRPGDES